MKQSTLFYWDYYTSELVDKQNILFSFFDIGEYKDRYMFLHISSGSSIYLKYSPILSQIYDYTYPIDELEEDMILDGMGEDGKRQYRERLIDIGIGDDYRLYAIALKEDIQDLIREVCQEVYVTMIKEQRDELEL